MHMHDVLGSEPVFRGCAYGSARSFRLGMTHSNGNGAAIGTEHVTLNGVIVAYEAYATASRPVGSEQGYFYVVVRNLRTGKLLDRVPTGVPLEPDRRHVGVGPVKAMVVKADGAVAWIALDDKQSELNHHLSGHEDLSYDLYALDRNGERLLASGTELAPSSLALAGSTLYWTQGGRPFSAGLD